MITQSMWKIDFKQHEFWNNTFRNYFTKPELVDAWCLWITHLKRWNHSSKSKHSSKYENIILIGDFNLTTANFCDIWSCKSQTHPYLFSILYCTVKPVCSDHLKGPRKHVHYRQGVVIERTSIEQSNKSLVFKSSFF